MKNENKKTIFGFQTWIIKKNERALLFKKGDFQRILHAGEHRFWNFKDEFSVQIFSLDVPRFDHLLSSYFLSQNQIETWINKEFVCIQVPNNHVGLLKQDNKFIECLAPNSQRLYWNGFQKIELQLLPLENQQSISNELLRELKNANVSLNASVFQIKIPEYSIGILSLDGKIHGLLSAGNHGFWKFGVETSVEIVDTRLQALEISGQEILTRDKVSLRINLTATFKYLDVLQAWKNLQKPQDHLYRELQFGLRAAVGTRTLDELLDNKTIIDETVKQHVASTFAQHGILVESVGVKDIVLPGEMKTLMAQVVEAEKAAQANVIRRREETNATRSLLNTAKVMESNPTALRLKELETLEKVAERIDKISVFGGLDSVLNGLVKLR